MYIHVYKLSELVEFPQLCYREDPSKTWNPDLHVIQDIINMKGSIH